MEILGRAAPPWEYIGDEEEAQEFLRYLDRFPEFAFDTETTGLTPVWKHTPLFISLCGGGRRACLPYLLLPVFKPLFEDPDKLKVGHNLKYDMHMVANSGEKIRIVDPIIDTLPMSVRENSARPEHGLKYLAADGLYEHTDERYSVYPSFDMLFGTKDLAWHLLNPENRSIVANYASMDTWCDFEAYKEMRSRLETTPAPIGNLWKLYMALEVPLTRVLWDYERAGFPIDQAALNSIRGPLMRDMQQLVQELAMLVGKPINPMSNTQVADLLYKHLGYQPLKYTKGGKSGNRQPSVDEEVLVALRNRNDQNRPILEKILGCRGLDKIKGTYVDGILKRLDLLGILHTTYNQGGAGTTRLSSSNPNVQNIPNPRNDKYGLRKAFRAPDGQAVVVSDFNQVEMIITAALSGDPTMISIINEGKDIHSMTAALMYSHDYAVIQAARKADPKTTEHIELAFIRDSCKTTGFRILYGGTPRALSIELGCTLEEAEEKQKRWFAQFPEIDRYIQETHRFVQAAGHVTSLLGWRRYFPAGVLEQGESADDHRRDPEFWKAMRASVNMTIQGSAADAMKIVLLRVHRDERLRDLGFVPRLTVHDEIVGTCPEDAKREALKRCIELATDPFEEFGMILPVHITASGGTGPSWGEAKG